jgi:iron complex transport system ATP-binding protein
MTPAAAPLRVTDLSVGYRLRNQVCAVLSGLNVQVQAGELVCLLGPNGIGKSTLLRTIAKVQPALSGVIDIAGENLAALGQMEVARRIAIVLTERVAVGALSGRQLTELGRYPHVDWLGRLSSHDHEVVTWALRAAGAMHLADRDSNRLSDGERQRLMIARALAQEPVVLILDEPTAFLDVASRVELMGLLRVLAREQNLAVVISTHDLELALRMADTLWLVMPAGSFRVGAPEDMIVGGHIAAAFDAANIIFQPEERMFRPAGGHKGRAVVTGSGLSAALARAVLEREGYAITDDGTAPVAVFVEQNHRWTVTAGLSTQTGDSYAMLAAFARQLHHDALPPGQID